MHKKILFCHIPKCSGTNINSNLSKKYNKNYIWYIHRILKYDNEKYNDYYKFAVIRDPIERLISVYFYQSNMISNLKNKKLLDFQDGNWKKIDNLFKKYNITDIYSFLNNYKIFYYNEIKPKILELKKNYKKINMSIYYVSCYIPQYLFILDNNYNLLVDNVINIKDINKFMYNKFKIKNNTKLNTHKNTNDNYYNYVTEKNKNDIKEIYKKDYLYLFNKH